MSNLNTDSVFLTFLISR